jgi:hypothetical protein
MSNLVKITALFSSAVLVFISISIEDYGSLLNSKLQNTGYENITSYCSIEKPNLFLLNRQYERLITSFKNLPISNLKKFTNDFNSNSISSEVRKLCISSEYISYSVIVYRNLTNRDIVFPFHYFW